MRCELPSRRDYDIGQMLYWPTAQLSASFDHRSAVGSVSICAPTHPSTKEAHRTYRFPSSGSSDRICRLPVTELKPEEIRAVPQGSQWYRHSVLVTVLFCTFETSQSRIALARPQGVSDSRRSTSIRATSALMGRPRASEAVFR
jgi:hypothetical protein